jgi:predicted transcriptional regulator
MNNMINNNTISDSATILDALKLLNDFTVIGYTLFVTDYSNRVIGTITDGDIRRRLIGGGALTDCVTTAMNREF